MKKWRVSDPCTCNEEDFETEAEALAYAEELLKGHREEACSDGEWPDETEDLKIFQLVHSAQVINEGTEEGRNWAEYGIRPAR